MSIAFDGSAGFTTNSGAVYDQIQRQVSKTASGVVVDFTGIPSWVKRITLILSNVSTNNSNGITANVGDVTGLYTTGQYSGVIGTITGTNTTNTNTITDNINIIPISTAADNVSVEVIFYNLTGNTWVVSGISSSSAVRSRVLTSSITLVSTLTTIRVTINGTDTFDAGSINIIYQ